MCSPFESTLLLLLLLLLLIHKYIHTYMCECCIRCIPWCGVFNPFVETFLAPLKGRRSHSIRMKEMDEPLNLVSQEEVCEDMLFDLMESEQVMMSEEKKKSSRAKEFFEDVACEWRRRESQYLVYILIPNILRTSELGSWIWCSWCT